MAPARCGLLFKQHTYLYITLRWLKARYDPRGPFHFLHPIGEMNRITVSIESTALGGLNLPHDRPLGCYAIVKELCSYGLRATPDRPEGG